MNEQVQQAATLMQATDMMSETALVDLGYRVVDKENAGLDIKHRGKFKSLMDEEKKSLKRRQAIEPIIGHFKADHRNNSCHLKGSIGYRLHRVLCNMGFNIRWLLRMIVKRALAFFAPAEGGRIEANCTAIAADFFYHSNSDPVP